MQDSVSESGNIMRYDTMVALLLGVVELMDDACRITHQSVESVTRQIVQNYNTNENSLDWMHDESRIS